jgi:two-component system, LytTR family, response regulator
MKTVMKAVIIDDEQDCCDVLETLLTRYCPEVKVIGICTSAAEGLTVLQANTVDLVFLDIQMPHMNGFELLEKLYPFSFSVIFTTSYDQYAIKAIRYSALDYLLKPVDKEELRAAVRKANGHLTPLVAQQLEILAQRISRPAQPINRIALPTMEGLHIIPADTIISCTSSSNYTILSLKEDRKLIVSRTLKEIEEMLEEHPFLRVHHSYLVNLNEVRKYIRGEGGLLIMSDGSSIDVSRSKKERLLKELGRRQ